MLLLKLINHYRTKSVEFDEKVFSFGLIKDIAVLPMFETANGFSIDTNPHGCRASIPTGSQWCLMAVGTYGPWQLKPQH
jgi:hypothetical protein